MSIYLNSIKDLIQVCSEPILISILVLVCIYFILKKKYDLSNKKYRIFLYSVLIAFSWRLITAVNSTRYWSIFILFIIVITVSFMRYRKIPLTTKERYLDLRILYVFIIIILSSAGILRVFLHPSKYDQIIKISNVISNTIIDAKYPALIDLTKEINRFVYYSTFKNRKFKQIKRLQWSNFNDVLSGVLKLSDKVIFTVKVGKDEKKLKKSLSPFLVGRNLFRVGIYPRNSKGKLIAIYMLDNSSSSVFGHNVNKDKKLEKNRDYIISETFDSLDPKLIGKSLLSDNNILFPKNWKFKISTASETLNRYHNEAFTKFIGVDDSYHIFNKYSLFINAPKNKYCFITNLEKINNKYNYRGYFYFKGTLGCEIILRLYNYNDKGHMIGYDDFVNFCIIDNMEIRRASFSIKPALAKNILYRRIALFVKNGSCGIDNFTLWYSN